MIEALTINKEFETDKTGSRLGPGDRCRGYPVASLPVGTTIDTNSNLIVVIGDNGSGKTTLTEKLGLQLSERGRSLGKNYFGVKPNGIPEGELEVEVYRRAERDIRDKTAEESRNVLHNRSKKIYKADESNNGLPSFQAAGKLDEIEETKCKPESERVQFAERSSTGEFQIDYISEALKRAESKGPGYVLILDQPEDAVSMRGRRKMVKQIADYASDSPDRQVFVVTHEPEFCKVPGARILNLDTYPVSSVPSEDFDVDAYLDG